MLETLIGASKARGPAPTFNLYDMVESILVLGEKGSVGRGRLGEELMLGPGAVRTLISRLKAKGYIAIGRVGCRLTKKGLSLYGELSAKLVFRGRLRCGDLGKECFSVCVRGAPSGFSVLRLRDVAVKAGANGALILSYVSGEFFFAGENVSFEKTQKHEWVLDLKSRFGFRDGDMLIVAFAEEKRAARDGALAAALSLLEG